MATTLKDIQGTNTDVYVTKGIENLAVLQGQEREEIFPEYECPEWTSTLTATYMRANNWENGVKANSIKANINATRIKELQDRATTDEQDISINKLNIGINTSDIAKNKETIETNTNNISTNAQNISKNAKDIDENKSEIAEVKSRTLILEESRGSANGVATLDTDGKIPDEQLPDMAKCIPSTQKGSANGVATLDTDGKIPIEQLPDEAMQPGGTGEINLSSYQKKSLIFTNVSVQTSLFTEDTTLTGYSFKAGIPCTGVTSNYVAQVTFDVTEAVNGNYAPVADTGSGIVIIYAKAVPKADITISTINLTKGGE